MNKRGSGIMKKKKTDIYHLIDESFLMKFSSSHISFMKNCYYSYYKNFCVSENRLPLEYDKFFTNMRRRKIKLIQVCCPYCGNMNLFIGNQPLKLVDTFNYCTSCGKRTASENAFLQIARLIRIQHFHDCGFTKLKEENIEEKSKYLTYDVYQLELIELTSILEVSLRDFFISFVYLLYRNSQTDYIKKLIKKSTANDFMNIEKANKHYKTALNINIRSFISTVCWDTLVDIIEIRNTLVHNNGLIDSKFRESATFSRRKSIINGNLIFLSRELMNDFFDNVLKTMASITKEFNNCYQSHLYTLIANYYFNLPTNNDTKSWKSLRDVIREH